MSTKVEAVVAAEVAEDEFVRFCETIDLEIDDLDDEDAKKFKGLKNTVIKAMMVGRVTISDEGLPTVSLKYPVGEFSSVTFKLPTGERFVAAGDTKSTNSVTQGWKILSDFTGVPSPIFGKMRRKPDLQTLDAVGALFLG